MRRAAGSLVNRLGCLTAVVAATTSPPPRSPLPLLQPTSPLLMPQISTCSCFPFVDARLQEACRSLGDSAGTGAGAGAGAIAAVVASAMAPALSGCGSGSCSSCSSALSRVSSSRGLQPRDCTRPIRDRRRAILRDWASGSGRARLNVCAQKW